MFYKIQDVYLIFHVIQTALRVHSNPKETLTIIIVSYVALRIVDSASMGNASHAIMDTILKVEYVYRAPQAVRCAVMPKNVICVLEDMCHPFRYQGTYLMHQYVFYAVLIVLHAFLSRMPVPHVVKK